MDDNEIGENLEESDFDNSSSEEYNLDDLGNNEESRSESSEDEAILPLTRILPSASRSQQDLSIDNMSQSDASQDTTNASSPRGRLKILLLICYSMTNIAFTKKRTILVPIPTDPYEVLMLFLMTNI